jgi:DNA-binding transcriptional LysR family regulator
VNTLFRHIRAFIAVAEERNFARGAERLHVSQSALSQTIMQLEATVGFDLFERTTRSVALTTSGERLLARARIVHTALDAFNNEARTMHLALNNELRAGYMIGTAVQFIPDIVREFERIRPGAGLHFQEFDFSDPSAGLRDRKVNCAIVRPPIGVDDVELVEIAREQCVACLPTGHHLSIRESVVVSDILDESIVAAPVPGVWRDYWMAMDYRDGRPAKVSYEAATVESELQAVAAGRGISITADSTARYYARPGVIFRPIIDMQECIIAVGYRVPPNKLVSDFISAVHRVSKGVYGIVARPPNLGSA